MCTCKGGRGRLPWLQKEFWLHRSLRENHTLLPYEATSLNTFWRIYGLSLQRHHRRGQTTHGGMRGLGKLLVHSNQNDSWTVNIETCNRHVWNQVCRALGHNEQQHWLIKHYVQLLHYSSSSWDLSWLGRCVNATVGPLTGSAVNTLHSQCWLSFII